MNNQLDFAAIERQISDGFINVQRHPSAPLMIYNYTTKAQYEWHWTPETKACRGLITDDKGNVVSRPFEKFFSYDQLNGVVPNEPFDVFEKLDGSLGILYWIDDEPHIATRGSFISAQAVRATEILRAKYSHVQFDRSLTYLLEIIYPENRIVVNYGDKEDLILLATIETATGMELVLADIGIPRVARYGITDFAEVLATQKTSAEGFVIRFESGMRVKVKFDEYKRLHKLLTGLNARHIWDILRSGDSMEKLLDRVPDEHFTWVDGIANNLRSDFAKIEATAKQQYRVHGSRRETADYFKTCQFPDVMFAMLDGKDTAPRIWKKLEPAAGRAFRCDNDV